MTERKKTPKSRHWMFTIFDQENHWTEGKMEMPGVRYLCVQGEECPETKTFHWQGYVQLKQNMTRKAVQRALAPYVPTFWCKPAEGTPEQARTYCTKDYTRIVPRMEFGEFSAGAGHRTDLAYIAKIIKDGGSALDVVEADAATYVRYHKGIEKLQGLMLCKEERKAPRVEWFWGAAGTGKSRAAMEENKGAYWKGPGKWWDGYDPKIHKTIVIDEWTPEHGMGQDMLLRLLDRYPLLVEPKGGSIPMLAEKIVVTSNYEPSAAVGRQQAAPLQRRIHLTRRFEAPGA